MDKLKDVLIQRFKIEGHKRDKSGVYAYTQRVMAYNSNKLEGSALTQEQTATLFDSGFLTVSDYCRAKDVEEMQGHFLMFDCAIGSLDRTLTEDLIKRLHFELKSGVFEDRANGYAIGEYKTRPNYIGRYSTELPQDVPAQMKSLLEWYASSPKTLRTLAKFHARYESIHPFQDGNGRTGRMIMFRESLINDTLEPFIVLASDRMEYLEGLKEYRDSGGTSKLETLIEKEIEVYKKQYHYFLGENPESIDLF